MKDNSQKKLMLLGGLRYLLPIIETAHKLGIYVITVDYIPDNIAHKYSDEYHNISILDKEEVLTLAQELKIDGIMSFAVDPGVVTAAYVAEKMGLPFQGSFESINILQDKAKFRKFLTENGFNVPVAMGYDNKEAALSDVDRFNWPIIVKPVDSAGSKGVSKVEKNEDLDKAIDYALSESHSGNFIIEDYLEKDGHSSDTEGFTIDGKLVFCSFDDQRFDLKADNPFTPAAYSWPSSMPQEAQEELYGELQRLVSLLELKTGIYNIETRLCKNGKTYIMEISPRGGGNRLAEMLDMAADAHLIENSVRSALSEPLLPMSMPNYNGNLAEVILHADKEGCFDRIEISDKINQYVIQKDLWVRQGDKVEGFTGANQALGTLVLRFPTKDVLEEAMSDISSWCKTIVK